jgi:hypothetical protein
MSGQGRSETSFVAGAKAMQETLVAWQAAHPRASIVNFARQAARLVVAPSSPLAKSSSNSACTKRAGNRVVRAHKPCSPSAAPCSLP